MFQSCIHLERPNTGRRLGTKEYKIFDIKTYSQTYSIFPGCGDFAYVSPTRRNSAKIF